MREQKKEKEIKKIPVTEEEAKKQKSKRRIKEKLKGNPNE